MKGMVLESEVRVEEDSQISPSFTLPRWLGHRRWTERQWTGRALMPGQSCVRGRGQLSSNGCHQWMSQISHWGQWWLWGTVHVWWSWATGQTGKGRERIPVRAQPHMVQGNPLYHREHTWYGGALEVGGHELSVVWVKALFLEDLDEHIMWNGWEELEDVHSKAVTSLPNDQAWWIQWTSHMQAFLALWFFTPPNWLR